MFAFIVTIRTAASDNFSGESIRSIVLGETSTICFIHQDHSVWRPLMTLLQGTPSNELLTVVTSTICNLLLEFSPSKEPMVESGCCEMLCDLTKSPDAALRLNGSWALMNMAFQVFVFRIFSFRSNATKNKFIVTG